MALRLGAALPDRRMLLGLGLAGLAAASVLWLTQPQPTRPVLFAASDLPAGTPLAELPIEVRHLSEPKGMVEGSEIGELAEWTLGYPIAGGEPLVPSLLRPPELTEAPNLLALDLEAAHAVLGRLAPGDLVDIYVTASGGVGEQAVTELAASSVYVVEARTAGSGVGGERVELLVAVDDGLAAALTAAQRAGELDLVRVGP